ncbi:hypothetical protein [Oscillibacter sp.]|uniref:hypothetical protein n=1 Tax=Oscillibacter sp. TaxID=1945593 RepID=UPI00289FBF04|nr:hypothetical protein [Oscillibacter sp.]
MLAAFHKKGESHAVGKRKTGSARRLGRKSFIDFTKKEKERIIMSKKLLSLALALVMSLSLCIPAWAATQNSTTEIITENTIQTQIQQEEARIFSSVYSQLKAQDALGLMDIYKEILIPEIEASVRSEYGPVVNSRSAASSGSDYTYWLPSGGSIGYTSTFGTTVLATFLTPSQYAEYAGDQSIVLYDFFLSTALAGIGKKIAGDDAILAETIGGWGTVFSMFIALKTYVDAGAQRSVAQANFYAKIIDISATGGTETGSVMIGWESHPYASIYDAQNIHITRF